MPMKSHTEHLWFDVPDRRGFVNITSTVEALVAKSGVREGLCLVNAMHITASVFINDAEDGLLASKCQSSLLTQIRNCGRVWGCRASCEWNMRERFIT